MINTTKTVENKLQDNSKPNDLQDEKNPQDTNLQEEIPKPEETKPPQTVETKPQDTKLQEIKLQEDTKLQQTKLQEETKLQQTKLQEETKKLQIEAETTNKKKNPVVSLYIEKEIKSLLSKLGLDFILWSDIQCGTSHLPDSLDRTVRETPYHPLLGANNDLSDDKCNVYFPHESNRVLRKRK